MESPNTTWPDAIPTNNQLVGIFYDVLGYRHQTDQASRLNWLKKRLVSEYLPLVTRLNRELAAYYRPPGGIPGRQVVCNPDGLSVQFHGLDRFEDTERIVLPEVRRLFDELCETNLSVEVKLSRMAAIAAVLTAESQSFGDGNTRVARALHDFVLRGAEGVEISDIVEVSRHFRPPEDLEDTIMRQNVTALVSSGLVSSPLPQGVQHIPEEVHQRIDENLLRLSPLFLVGGSDEDSDGYLSGLDGGDRDGMFHQNLLNLGILEDYELNVPVEVALRQSLYGAAAWTAAFWEECPTLPLSKSASERLGQTSAELMRFRMFSLLRGLANGGDFPLIEEYDHGRSIRIDHWWPSGAHDAQD